MNGPSKEDDISSVLGLSSSRTRVILKEMNDIIPEGINKNTKYRLIEK